MHEPASRFMLAAATDEARKLGAKIRKAFVCCHRNPNGERFYLFEYDGFSTEVWADDAYHARALGWERWIAAETANRKA